VKQCGRNLITGHTTGVIQAARAISGLIYGTREPALGCKGKGTMGSPQRLNINAQCWDGLTCSSEEVSVMGMERRG